MEGKPSQVGTRVYVIMALISALAVISAALLGNETVVHLLVRNFTTKTLVISIVDNRSGTSTFLNGDSLLTFENHSSIAGPGDTEDDQLMRSFLSFHLGDVPKDAIILSAQVEIPYGITGYPEGLGSLALRQFPFGQYSQQAFYGIPTDGWSVGWSLSSQAVSSCRNGPDCGTLVVNNEGLREFIQTAVPGRWAQFALYFDSNLVLPDQKLDALILLRSPRLVLKYYVPLEPSR